MGTDVAVGIIVFVDVGRGVKVGTGVLDGVFDGTAVGTNVAVGVIVGGSPTNVNVPEAFQLDPTKT